ncbi:hypothetical protein F4809DRAFT_478678 [Biscogniauxia mediterranea]|nr:hypothetical protein F4809DRAFT_478678 [Biscogniauxia mediterranea]
MVNWMRDSQSILRFSRLWASLARSTYPQMQTNILLFYSPHIRTRRLMTFVILVLSCFHQILFLYRGVKKNWVELEFLFYFCHFSPLFSHGDCRRAPMNFHLSIIRQAFLHDTFLGPQLQGRRKLARTVYHRRFGSPFSFPFSSFLSSLGIMRNYLGNLWDT